MALNGALVDRARILRQASSPVRVEGRTSMTTVRSAWFRVRLELGAAPKSQTAEAGKRTVRSPRLLVALRDAEGRAVNMTAMDFLEVDSPQLGRAVYQITGDLEPMRKKRRVIGWEVGIKLVDEHPFDRDMVAAGALG